LKYIKYVILEFAPSLFSFIPLPHSWKSFNRFHFSIYLHMCIVFALYSPSYIFSPHAPPVPLVLTPLFTWRSCSDLLFSDFVKEKKWHFSLFKIATQRVSLWHFHIYMYYGLDWLISSIFLHSILVPLYFTEKLQQHFKNMFQK
jgi:hypothetical protein